MLGRACHRLLGDHSDRSLAEWLAPIYRCIRGDHHFYAAPAGVNKLFVASRSLGDDPVFRKMGSADYFSGDCHLGLIPIVSGAFDALVIA